MLGHSTALGRVLFSGRRGVPIAAKFPAPNPNIGSTKLYRAGGTTGVGGNAFHTLMPSEGRFSAGFLKIVNVLATAVTVDGAMVAPTAAPNDFLNPLDGAGAAQAWTNLGAGPWTIPVAPVPGLAGASIPSIGYIPFTVNSIDRTDIIGAPPLLMARLHFSTPSSPFQTSNAANFNDIATLSGGKRVFQGAFKGMTLANFNNPALFTTPSFTYFGNLAASFVTSVPTYTVLELNDSTGQGAKSGPSQLCDYAGAGFRACGALSSIARPVYYACCAVQGQTMAQIIAQADTWIREFAPQAVILPIWSSNSLPTTQASADATFQQMLNIADKCTRSGIKVFLVTANPLIGISAANDLIRKQTNENARNSVYTCIDKAAPITTGGSPDTFVSGTLASDNTTHCNDAGYDLQDTSAGSYRPMISAWLDASNAASAGSFYQLLF